MIHDIKTLMAFDKFCNFKFKESMDIFFSLNTCPSHVIGLVPGMLPGELEDKLRYPDERPRLNGNDHYYDLITYLTEVRHKLKPDSVPHKLEPKPIVEGVPMVTSKKIVLEMIDTTLLKCYLKTNEAMIASLLRVPDNRCHLEEAERVLKRAQKLSELVILYNTRGLHRKALELLRTQSTEKESPLSGHARTVTYLQNLGPDHIDLILEFSLWVITDSPDDGFAIFTEEMEEVETLPRNKVLDWLMKNSPQHVIFYLEHVIQVWGEENSLFHNSLILQYKDIIVDAHDTHSSNLWREEYKKKLLRLQNGGDDEVCHYRSEELLPMFPVDQLHEERAILLGRGGRHRDALTVYLTVMGDLDKAKQHCAWAKANGRQEAYQDLVELLVASGSSGGDLRDAVAILEQHWEDVNIVRALQLLPAAAQLDQLQHCVAARMQAQVAARHGLQLVRALHHSKLLQLEEQRVRQERVMVKINEKSVCSICNKTFTTHQAFVREISGHITHYKCKSKS